MNAKATTGGTRFLLHPQPAFLAGFEQPVVHTLDLPAGTVNDGPADDRIKVVDAQGKALYDDHTLPPYSGKLADDLARPSDDGHFDHLGPGTRAFRAAHAFAGMRMVLDVWEGYAGEPVRWFFADEYARLEVIPEVDWENGQAGFGFVELGHGIGEKGKPVPFSLNFDVLAHEMGHIILVSEIGMPWDSGPTQYRGFQESAADILSLVSVLHFESFRHHLLDTTRGNLYAPNELNSLAELSPSKQIRTASHGVRMSDIAFAEVSDRLLTQEQIHALGQPFTAAVFDILVEVYHETLVETGLITRALDELSDLGGRGADATKQVDREFSAAYAQAPDGFMRALEQARDMVGARLAGSWKRLDPETLTLWDAAVGFLTVDRELSGLRYQEIIRDCFMWRRFTP